MKAKKAIYFPTGCEAGMVKGRLQVIWVVAAFPEGGLHFVNSEDEIESRRYAPGRANCAVPFSPILWHQIEVYLQHLDAVEDEYRRLEKYALKRGGAKHFRYLLPTGLFDF